MNTDIALWLLQDGVTSGAIYALMALALLLVFAVTRVIFVPQGDFLSYAALSLGWLQQGKVPGTVWLLVGASAWVGAAEALQALRAGEPSRLVRVALQFVLAPLALAALVTWAAPRQLGLALQAALVVAVVVPLGPLVYRIAFRPLAQASVLVLFIVSMAVHYALTGIGLVMFGGEGLRTNAVSDARFDWGVLKIGAQSLWVLGASLACMLALWLFFERSLVGKALRATAINRVGSLLVGIPTAYAGRLAFGLAAAIGALSGILISPITTIYYDTGLMIGLKGFVGAILGGMGSYPLAALGALGLGLLESFSSFWASAYKEVIVFTVIIPVLLWRSLLALHPVVEDEEE
ncbi:MAG: branched-chain amino acid ABC transporter permease [Ideonella sp.]|nr:branched-chain amino acid ABC transporter permease [Ideonella sp.]MCC7457294.1 branched-chain amino acid ABC transporter permease [Nitrospira sp.]